MLGAVTLPEPSAGALALPAALPSLAVVSSPLLMVVMPALSAGVGVEMYFEPGVAMGIGEVLVAFSVVDIVVVAVVDAVVVGFSQQMD